MPKVTIVFGLLLIALGAYGYFGAPAEPDGKTSVTALIPAFVGGPLLLCGLVALAGGKVRMHAMHVAAMLGVLGTLAAGGRGLSKIGALLSDDPDLNRRAVYMVLAMAAICLVFTILCVQSFISARKAREANEAGDTGAPAPGA